MNLATFYAQNLPNMTYEITSIADLPLSRCIDDNNCNNSPKSSTVTYSVQREEKKRKLRVEDEENQHESTRK